MTKCYSSINQATAAVVLALLVLVAIGLPATVEAVQVCGLDIGPAPTSECYVNATSGNDAGTEGNMTHPFQTILYAFNSGCRLIQLQPGTHEVTAELTISINDDILHVVGLGHPADTVVAMNAVRFADVTTELFTILFDSVTVQSGRGNGAPGGVINQGSGGLDSVVYIQNCAFVDNRAFTGGAIALQDGSMVMCDSTFRLNSANNGGVVSISNDDTGYGSVVVKNCTFVSNVAANEGGAFRVTDMDMLVSDSSFSGNQGKNGGAIYDCVTSFASFDGADKYERCSFTGNSAEDYGGVLYMEQAGGTFEMSDTVFCSNSAPGEGGGAIYLYDGEPVNMTFVNVSFFNGLAEWGAAIEGTTSEPESSWNFTDCEFRGNHNTNSLSTLYISGGTVTGSNNRFCADSGSGGDEANAATSDNGWDNFQAQYQCEQRGAASFQPLCPNCTEVPIDATCSLCSDFETVCPQGAPTVTTACGEDVVGWTPRCYVSTTGSDTDSGTDEEPFATISHAVEEDCHTIYLFPGDYDESPISKNIDGQSLHIYGMGDSPDDVVISSGGSIFSSKTSSGRDLVVKNVTFSNGRSSDVTSAGCVSLQSDGLPLQRGSFQNVRFVNCTGPDQGGAIHAQDTFLNVCDSSFEDNQAGSAGSGGAIYIAPDENYAQDVYAVIERTRFSNNTAAQGGAIRFQQASADSQCQLNVSDVVFCSNTASAGGGAASVFLMNGTARFSGSDFLGGMASNGGGLDVNTTSQAVVQGCNFNQNEASGTGGGFAVNDASLISGTGNTFCANTATDGSAAYAEEGDWPNAFATVQCQSLANFMPACGSCVLDSSPGCGLCQANEQCLVPPSASPSPSPSPTPTSTPSPPPSPSPTPTPTPTPSPFPTPSSSPSQGAGPSPSSSNPPSTPPPSHAPSASPAPLASATPDPTAVPTSVPTTAPTVIPTADPSPTPVCDENDVTTVILTDDSDHTFPTNKRYVVVVQIPTSSFPISISLTGLNIENTICMDTIDVSFYETATDLDAIDPTQVDDDVVIEILDTISGNFNRHYRSVQAAASITIANTNLADVNADSFVFAEEVEESSSSFDFSASVDSPSPSSDSSDHTEELSFSFSSASAVSTSASACVVAALVAAMMMMM